MKNKTIISILFFALLISFSSVSLAENDNNNIVIYIEGEEVSEELEPILREDRTYAPVRSLAETLGAKVKYNPEDRRIIISDDKLEISMWVENQYVIVNEKETETDSPVFIENDRSYAPLRFLAEWFDYEVYWDGESRKIELTPIKEETEEPDDKEEADDKEETEETAEKEEYEEVYHEPDFSIDLENEEINIALNVEEYASVDESVYREHNIIEKQKENDKFTFYFTGEKYKKSLNDFNDPLLDEITLEPVIDNNEDTDEEDIVEKINQMLNEGLNVNKLTVELKYPVPLENFEIYDKFEHENKLEFNISRIFEVLKEEFDVEAGLRAANIIKGMKDGPVNINKLYFDPLESDLELDLVIAEDKINGLESIEDMAKRKNAIAAINGGYFHWQGDPLGLVIRDGLLITHPRNSGSALVVNEERNLAEIKQFDLGDEHLALVNSDFSEFDLSVDYFNKGRGRGDVIVYTREYGETTGTSDHSARRHLEFVVENDKVIEINVGDSEIPDNGYVISVHELNNELTDWKNIEVGDEILLKWDFEPELSMQNVSFALGAGPGLITEGEIDIKIEEENVADNISRGRNPRTAVGIFPDGKLLLVTVDGRAPTKSIGFELEELAGYLRDLGVESALNLDGGGSTMMWLEGEIVNNPSGVSLRNIGNAIVIV